MRTIRIITIAIFLLFNFFNNVEAQNISLLNSDNTLQYMTSASPLAEDFSGFKIQLFHAEKEVASDNGIFEKFDYITFEKSLDDHFLYCVEKFSSEVEAEAYLMTIIERYPCAKIVEYQGGERVNYEAENMPAVFFDIWK